MKKWRFLKMNIWINRIVYIMLFVCFGWVLCNRTTYYFNQKDIKKIVEEGGKKK